MFDEVHATALGGFRCVRGDDVLFVPDDFGNVERQRIAEWVEAGGEIVPAPVPPVDPVPTVVSISQAKRQLSRAGFLARVDEAFAAMRGQRGEEARIEWEYATELRRDHRLVAVLAQLLELDDAAVDELFRAAAKL